MNIEQKNEISNSFVDSFKDLKLDIKLSIRETNRLREGIYAESMEDKWNIFILKKHIYFARSWTEHCIYKVEFEDNASFIVLKNLRVTNNSKHYNWIFKKLEPRIFKRLIQTF